MSFKALKIVKAPQFANNERHKKTGLTWSTPFISEIQILNLHRYLIYLTCRITDFKRLGLSKGLLNFSNDSHWGIKVGFD